MKNINILAILLLTLIIACDPFEEDGVDIPDLPAPPPFTAEMIDSNSVVVNFSGAGYLSHVFSAPTATVKQSTALIDTFVFPTIGEHSLTLHATATNGGGNAQNTKSFTILRDLPSFCDDITEMLVGDCADPNGTCWIFSQANGAISVGPFIGDLSWFASPPGSLAPEQYDDKFCFAFGQVSNSYTYDNNYATIDPWLDFSSQLYDPPTDMTFTLTEGGVFEGTHKLELFTDTDDKPFIGVWNTGPIYDIVSFSEDELVLRSPITDRDGEIEEGFFEVILIKE